MTHLYLKQVLTGKILSFLRKKSPLSILLLICLVTGSFVQTTPLTASALPAATYCVDQECYFLGKNTFTDNGTTNTRPLYVNGLNQWIGYLNGGIISRVMTSNSPCALPATATSNALTMTVGEPVNISVCVEGGCSNVAGEYVQDGEDNGRPNLYDDKGNNMWYFAGDGQSPAGWYIDGEDPINGTVGLYYNSSESMTPPTDGWVVTEDNTCIGDISVTIGACGACLTIFNITGGGTICPTGSAPIGLDGSEVGVSYQLYFDGTPLGDPVEGTGNPLDFGDFTPQGVYNVTASNANCSNVDMKGTEGVLGVDISHSSAVILSVGIAANPSGSITSGTSVTFTATPTNGGTTPTYQWKKNNNNVGTNSNQYTDNTLVNGDVIKVVMTPSSEVCATTATSTSNEITMTVTAACTYNNITVSGFPSPYTGANGVYTPNGTKNGAPQWSYSAFNIYWSGTRWEMDRMGVDILSFNTNGSITNLPCSGWATTSFGTPSLSGGCGNITCETSCTPPTALSVTGGGGYCEAQNILVAGLPVGLAGNSESGVSYQLYRNDDEPVGSPINGNGQPISFGNQTAGFYTVVATRSPGCSTTMDGAAIIEAIPTPTTFNVTGGGGICPGGGAVSINLSGSENGVSYQVKRNNANVGDPVLGDGDPLSFGPFSTPGTYTIAATRTYAQSSPTQAAPPSEVCSADMNGTAQIINLSASAGTLAANQSICAGTAPASLSVSDLVGNVVKWQRATNANFTGATDINVAAATLPGSTIGSLSADTWFRAVIQNGTCPAINTNAARITVQQPFTASAEASNSLICSNQTLRLTALPNQAGLTYNWRGPANFSSNLQSPTRTGLTTAMSGVYSVTITRSACNASGSATVSVVVSPSGSAFAPQMSQLRFNNTAPNAQNNTVGVCAGSAVTLNITANQHALTYSWRGPAGGSGSGFMSAPVSGVTNASASISAAVASNQQGQYTVTVRNGCNVSNHKVVNLQVRNCTSTRLASAEGESTLGLAINLAPNPVRDYLTASFEGVEGQTIQLQLIDAQGRSRQQASIEAAEGKAQYRFDVRSLPAGMYLLQAETATQRATKKVIRID